MLPADQLICFLVSHGASSSINELLDFYHFKQATPSLSALNQQRSKLKPEAIEALFHCTNEAMANLETSVNHTHTEDKESYRTIAVDGSTFSFPSSESFATSDYYSCHGKSAKGSYSVHVTALYDLKSHLYLDAVIQSVHNKNEYLAFCTMADRFPASKEQSIFIADRGFCSYNNMAHVMENGENFLFRAKDVTSKGLLKNFGLPTEGSFDTDITVTLVRSHSKQVLSQKGMSDL